MRAITITQLGEGDFFEIKIEGIYPFIVSLLELITIRNIATERIISTQAKVAADINFRLPPEQAKLCFD